MSVNPKPRRVLVTGGAGFIGSHLVESLLEQGQVVRVLDNFSTGKRENLEGLGGGRFLAARDFELIEGDIRDYATVAAAVEGTDAVLHQAALGSVPRSVADPLTTHQVNADGTLNVLLAGRDHKLARVIYASSSAVYGDSQKLPKREGEEGRPLSPYALTKRINEEHGRLFMELYGLQTIGLRYFNVYGPRQDARSDYAAVIPRFVTALLAGDSPVIYGTGTQTRDFTYIKDVVQANLLALDAPPEACGLTYNVGRGGQFDLLELLATLQSLLKTHISPRNDPPRPGDVMHSCSDTSSAGKMLGYKPRYDLEQGLAESIDWYRNAFI
jgi:nucleoside-diphosphate-sugar epimerase